MSPDLILDPDPDNILGKGLLDPEREAALLADGCVFAMWCVVEEAKLNMPPFLIRSKRPIAEAITDALLDAYAMRFAPSLHGERESFGAAPVPSARRPIVA